MNCNYMCLDSMTNLAAWFYKAHGGHKVFLCENCHSNATDLLKVYCEPVNAPALEMDCS